MPLLYLIPEVTISVPVRQREGVNEGSCLLQC